MKCCVKKMTNKFAVFILSHGRPFRQLTYNMLTNGEIESDVFIVCDDEDETLEEYKEQYGSAVIVFSKSQYIKKVDTVDNFKKKSTPVYARHAIFDIAKEKGFRNFVMADDDISAINLRFEKEGKLAHKKITDFQSLFEDVIEYQNSASINTICFAMDYELMGGLRGKFSKGFTREGYSLFFLRTDLEHNFIGTIAEDLNHSWITQQSGAITLGFMRVQVSLEEVAGVNEGGLHEIYRGYEDSLKYMQIIYALIPRPDSVFMGYNRSGFIRRKNLKTMYPLIISERWRK